MIASKRALPWRRASRMFEEIQSLPELGRHCSPTDASSCRHHTAEGRRLIARARDIFARIGAVGWVAEADAALT